MAIRHQLKQGLAALPKPKETEWELELPEEELEPTAAEETGGGCRGSRPEGTGDSRSPGAS